MKLFKEKGVLYTALDPASVVILLALLVYSLISQGIIPLGRSTPGDDVSLPPPGKPPIEKEVSLPKTYSIEGVWRVTIASVEFLPGEKNLRFNLLIENLQDKPAECVIVKKTYLLDNLGNKYRASKISPTGKRSLIQNMPLKANIVFPEFKTGAESVILYLYFAGNDLESGWIGGFRYGDPLGKELYCGPIKLEKIPSVEGRIEEVSLPKTFVTEDGNWSVIVDSYEFLGEGEIQFALLIENLQEKTAECIIDKGATYLLDNLANEYHSPKLSIEGYRKFVSHMPIKVLVTFPELKKEVEAVVFYLRFSPRGGAVGDWAIGPIKLEE